MELHHWGVDGYRNLLDIELNAGDSAVLIGLNNSGKSNLLLSLRDYLRIMNDEIVDLSRWFEQNRLKNKRADSDQIKFKAKYRAEVGELTSVIDSLAQTTEANVRNQSIFFDEESWEEVRANQPGGIDFVHVMVISEDTGHEYLHIDGKNVFRWEWNFDNRSLENNEFVLRWKDKPETDTRISGEGYWEFGTLLNEIYETFRTLGPIRDPEPTTDSSRGPSGVGVDPRATELVATIETIGKEEMGGDPILDRIEQDFVSIVEDISGIKIANAEGDSIFDRSRMHRDDDESEGETIFLEHDYTASSESSVLIPLENASTGTQELLALLSRIYLTEYLGGLLLVEEPEIHLHPRAEKVVINRIKRTIKDSEATVILSTHSERMIQAVSLERIHSVRTDEDGYVDNCRGPADGELPTHIQAQLGQLLQAEFVVVTESAVDIEILKIFLNRYFMDDEIEPLLKIDFVSCGHRGQTFEEVSAIRDCLQSFQVPYCCVFNQLGRDRDDISSVVREIVELDDEEFLIWEAFSIESWLLSESTLESILPTAEVDPDIFENEDNPREALEKIFATQGWRYSEQRPYRPITDGVRIAKEIDMDEFPDEFERFAMRIRDTIGGE